jgi:hypothetical protein
MGGYFQHLQALDSSFQHVTLLCGGNVPHCNGVQLQLAPLWYMAELRR